MLPRRQRQAYEYILRCITANKLPPTVAEIKEEFGLSSLAFANDILEALARKGFISLERPLSAPRAEAPAVFLPVMGEVAAGLPALDETGEVHWGEIARDWVEVPRGVLERRHPSNFFVMEVDGD